MVLGLLALGAGALLLWWRLPSRNPREAAGPPAGASALSTAAVAARQRAVTPRPAPASPDPVAPAAASASPTPPAEPPALAAFRPAGIDALSAERQAALAAELRRIPRPPSALQHLTSPAFLERASSVELSDLIMAEARVAAKVLATVNSPFFGLQRPVTSVGQAVTFLGLNTVRNLCLQALLQASFDPGQPELRRRLEAIGRASLLASELCARLAPRLGLPAPGTLVTQLVLSFLGPLASAALMAGERRGTDDLLDRSLAEQARLGLPAAALGGMLLRLWELPPEIVDEVVAIDAILVTPARPEDPPQLAQRALAYLCARLGERLASGRLAGLAGYDPRADDSADFFHLRGHLRRPVFARLAEQLQSADIAQALKQVDRERRG